MASGKVARRTVVADVAALLDSPEIAALLADLDAAGSPRVQRHTQRFRDLYRGRSAVEREFGRLKTLYGLGPLRVRGLARVQLHADLTILARLSNALIRARELSVAT